MNTANVTALRQVCEEYKALLRQGNIAPHALRQTRGRLIETIYRECVGHTHLFGRHLVMPHGETLINLTEWVIQRAERGELPDPAAIRVV